MLSKKIKITIVQPTNTKMTWNVTMLIFKCTAFNWKRCPDNLNNRQQNVVIGRLLIKLNKLQLCLALGLAASSRGSLHYAPHANNTVCHGNPGKSADQITSSANINILHQQTKWQDKVTLSSKVKSLGKKGLRGGQPSAVSPESNKKKQHLRRKHFVPSFIIAFIMFFLC